MFAPVRVISESDEEGSNFDKLKRVETSRSAAVKYGGERRRGRRGADGLHMLRVPMMPIDVSRCPSRCSQPPDKSPWALVGIGLGEASGQGDGWLSVECWA